MGACALHTVIGRNSRRRKGLERSRRLSETTGPHGASKKRGVSDTAHRRLGVTVRHRAGCTCYRESSRPVAHVTADLRGMVKCPVHGPVHRFPRMRVTVMFSLPLHTLRAVVHHAVKERVATRCSRPFNLTTAASDITLTKALCWK